MLEKIANALELKPQELFAEPKVNFTSNTKKDRIISDIINILDRELE